MENNNCSEWPLVRVNGELMLFVPLEDGAASGLKSSRGLLEAQGEFLKIVVPKWLAEMLEVGEGDFLRVSNADGEFQIQPVQPPLMN